MRRQPGAPFFPQGKVGYRVAPSSAPVCALGHLWFMVASPGPDRTVPRTVRPPRGRLWRLSFAKMLSSIFSLENASQIGLSIPEEIAPRTHQRQPTQKPASDNERPSKPGVQGLAPALFLPISREKWGPPPGRRGPRGAAPQGRLRSCPPEGYAPPPAPPHTEVWLTRAATARAARTPEAPAWASPRVIPAPSPAAKKLGRAVSRSGESFSRAE